MFWRFLSLTKPKAQKRCLRMPRLLTAPVKNFKSPTLQNLLNSTRSCCRTETSHIYALLYLRDAMSSLKAFAREARRNAAPEPPKKNAVRGTMSSHLSAERVQDSSEEEEEEESDEDSSSDDEPAPRKQAVTLSKVNGNSASKVAETEESDSKDSDSDSTDSSAPAKPVVAAPKTNGKVTSKEVGAKKTDSSTSDSSSSSSSGDGESSEESEEEAATPSMKKNPSVAEPARYADKFAKVNTTNKYQSTAKRPQNCIIYKT